MEALERYLRDLVASGRRRKIILERLKIYHNISWSVRTLNRYLSKFGIKRYDRTTTFNSVATAIAQERRGPGLNAGIRSMHLALRQRHGLYVPRSAVADAITLTEPERSFTKSRSFPWTRALVYCPGPNFRWCEDGYDKVGARYGIFIHGCVDQYSRKVLWLRANVTNRAQELIATYYLDTVQKLGVVPDYVSSDFGHESGLIAVCQAEFFRDDTNPGKHHTWTYSVRNQTIERWWRELRKMATQYWLNEFQALENEHLWQGDVIDRWALLLIYLPLVQADLDRVISDYNDSTIRKQRDRIRPGGRPDDLYSVPHLFGGRQCGKTVTNEDIARTRNEINLIHYDMPLAVPAPVSRSVAAWFSRNGVLVTRENAKLLYQQVRLLLQSLCNEDA